MCARSWGKRRQLLHELYELTPHEGVWRVSTAFADGDGQHVATAGMGLEGVVAKRVTSRYWPGRRASRWCLGREGVSRRWRFVTTTTASGMSWCASCRRGHRRRSLKGSASTGLLGLAVKTGFEDQH